MGSETRIDGKWEVVDCGEMVRIRWSLPAAGGEWFWCAHYPNDSWGKNAVDRICQEWNAIGKLPPENHGLRVPLFIES
jgi:hypothetical protein